MKTLIILLSVLMLTACKEDAVPVTMKFPEIPKELMVACPDLENIKPDTDKISDVLKVVTDNYMQYHECRSKVNNWIEWYNTQKPIFDKVGK